MFAVTRSLTLQEPPLRRLPGWRGIWRSFLVERAAVDKIVAQLIEEEAPAALGTADCSPCSLVASTRTTIS